MLALLNQLDHISIVAWLLLFFLILLVEVDIIIVVIIVIIIIILYISFISITMQNLKVVALKLAEL